MLPRLHEQVRIFRAALAALTERLRDVELRDYLVVEDPGEALLAAAE
jgi:hypothetical protein